MNNQIQLIPLSRIKALDEVQSRITINKQKVREYIEAMLPKRTESGSFTPGDIFPAIQVVQDGDEYLVADGFHRIAAYQKVYRRTPDTLIAVCVLPPFEDWAPAKLAAWHSSMANHIHGIQRSAEDKINTVRMYLTFFDNAGKSNRQIARELKVHATLHVAPGRRLYLKDMGLLSSEDSSEDAGALVSAPVGSEAGQVFHSEADKDKSDQSVTSDSPLPVVESRTPTLIDAPVLIGLPTLIVSCIPRESAQLLQDGGMKLSGLFDKLTSLTSLADDLAVALPKIPSLLISTEDIQSVQTVNVTVTNSLQRFATAFNEYIASCSAIANKTPTQ